MAETSFVAAAAGPRTPASSTVLRARCEEAVVTQAELVRGRRLYAPRQFVPGSSVAAAAGLRTPASSTALRRPSDRVRLARALAPPPLGGPDAAHAQPPSSPSWPRCSRSRAGRPRRGARAGRKLKVDSNDVLAALKGDDEPK